uniref:UDP-N-acetylglucosamine diphosphorylase n=1 Tax=Globodera rostochiensis TaxID=31243 RepID=A0A914HFG1_GLORO
MENVHDQLNTYQPKLASYLQALTDDDRATFITHLQKFDFSYLNSAFNRALEPKLPCAEDIQPIPAQQKVDRAQLSEGETERLTKIGLKAVAEGRVAAVVLAGGQASRLGSAHPKGVLRLGTGLGQNSSADSLLFIQAAQIARLQRMARERFPTEANESGGHITWLVMTSGTTDRETRDHLAAVFNKTGLSPAQLLVFTQNEIPAFDFNGHAFLKDQTQLVTAPDGNGGFYDAICPLLPELEKRGVQHLHIYCVDNILCRVADPLMIGCAIDRGADCTLKVIEKRDPAELVGHVCLVQGLVRVLEYSEITRELADRRCPNDPSKLFLNAGSIANHVVTLAFLREACAKADAVLPYHVARKRIPFWDPNLKTAVQPSEPNGIKLERFIFDAFTLSKTGLLWQVPAVEEFSPLKNPESAGVDCLSTCVHALKEPHAQWIREACISKLPI